MTTIITDPPPSKTRLGVGFDADRSHASDKDAWKRAIGTKQVPARLGMLPEGEPRWDRLGVSAGVQVVLLVFFVALPLFFPERIKTVMNFTPIGIAMPVTEVPVAAPPRAASRPAVPRTSRSRPRSPTAGCRSTTHRSAPRCTPTRSARQLTSLASRSV